MASHAHEHGLLLDPAALAYSWAAEPEFPPQLLAALGEYLSSSSSSTIGARGGEGGHQSAPEVDAEADAEADDEFMMYEFKVRRCARARSHDWTACPYAHPGEAARRRDPHRVAYAGEPCPDYRRRPGAACPRGASCPFAHGTFELWLHPSRYRTRPCRAGLACRRRVCFFAHAAGELRAAHKGGPDSPLALSPKSTLTALWESPPVSPVEGRMRWLDLDAIDDAAAADAEVEEIMLAMQQLSFAKAAAPSASSGTTQALPPVTEDDGPDLGWVTELVM
ncbi:zinc finger CCCH domain-containing protein 37-like [Hordeum vulgare subsp. vulgare]|uniref:C3H1-type domain-containing protein n=1 Tax=Hordeum vulgare subsp. vulgare TaxID=112509 RepID=A0A8I6WIQ6_HORVV|nr:zinc finger CCCH domain-containing protein 37-like [Hordeum vulgare subsp. vulgare]